MSVPTYTGKDLYGASGKRLVLSCLAALMLGLGTSVCAAGGNSPQTTSSAVAASFDCSKASSSAEKMICANSPLSEQDDILSRLYKWTLEEAASVNKSKIIADQKNWIAQKRDTCTTTDCLNGAYGARIEELAAIKFDGGSATYVGDAADIARISKQIQQDLREVGFTQALSTCSHILSLDSHSTSYGAFCVLGKQKSVEVCDENKFGNLAVNFSFERTGKSLAAFTQFACPGG